MKERLLRLMGIESGEESMVLMLLTQSVFLGVFFGTFDISAHSLFLSEFDEKMMARAYVVSGLAGIILTSVYTGLQSRMQFRLFSIINLLFVTIFTLCLWALIVFFPTQWVTFLVFIMLGPLNILALLGFWGTAGRLFSLRQGKRLFGLVDAGLLIGVILSCYAIPVLLSFHFESHNLLLLSAGAVLTGSLFQILIGSKHHFSAVRDTAPGARENKAAKKSLLQVFREEPYIRVMGLFIALSVMTAFFVQYSFMAVTREQYPSEEDMARFLGLFTGSMMIFTFLVKILVFSYLIRNYGLKTCLALSPVLVAAFTIGAIALGMLMGYTPETSGFLLFFMLLALSRLFSKALKDSIESPAFKVIYQTIDEKDRFRIQSGMDGTVNEISALTSGLLLAGLGMLTFIRLIHFSVVLLLITSLWILLAFRLYKWYRQSIRKALEPGEKPADELASAKEKEYHQNHVAAAIGFANEYYALVTGDAELRTLYNSEHLIRKIIHYADKGKDTSLIPILAKIASDKYISQPLRISASDTKESLELQAESNNQQPDRFHPDIRMFAGERKPQTSHLLRLLRNKSLEQKRTAIILIGKYRMAEMIPEVCESLGIPGLEITSRSVLKSFGTEAAPELARYYMASSGNIAVNKTIINLMVALGNEESTELLFSGLWSGSRELRETALEALKRSGFKPTEDERDRLHQLISDVIGLLAWNIGARIILHKNNDILLEDTLNNDNRRWENFLFGLLSIAYEASSIERIRENLEKGSVESVNFALEMIDIVVDESVKPKLIPIIDMIPDEERFKGLNHFYPSGLPSYDQLIINLLNRDYNVTGIWIRARVLHNLENIASRELSDTVVSLLFSPSLLLREEAARLVAKSKPDIFEEAAERIPLSDRSELEKMLAEKIWGACQYEKAELLFKAFPLMAEEPVLWLARALKYFPAWDSIGKSLRRDCVIWHLSETDQIMEVKIISDDSDPEQNLDFGSGKGCFYLLPLEVASEMDFLYPAHTEEFLGYIEKNLKY